MGGDDFFNFVGLSELKNLFDLGWELVGGGLRWVLSEVITNWLFAKWTSNEFSLSLDW